jgi:hypothetical protein
MLLPMNTRTIGYPIWPKRFVTAFGADDAMAFTSVAQVKAFLGRVLAYMDRAEADLLAWRGALMQQIALRIATCAEIAHYNAQSLYVYGFELDIVAKLRAAGLEGVPDPPFPPVIGRRVVVQSDAAGNPLYSVETPDCDANGYPLDWRGLQVNPPRCPGGIVPPLGEAATIALIGFGTALVGLVTWWIAGDAAKSVALSIFTKTDEQRANAAMQSKMIEEDGRRATWVTNCTATQRAALRPEDTSLNVLQTIAAKCREDALVLMPPGKPPYAPYSSGVVAGLAVVGVVILGGFLAYRFLGRGSSK